MTGIAFHNPAGLHDPSPFGYSHVARVPAGHDLLFVAGQGGFGPDLSMSPDFRTQTRQAIANLAVALTANGGTLADVVRTTLLIVGYDADVFVIMAEELALAWPDAKPASTLIPVERLALPGMLIEIEATAALAAPI